MKPFNSIADLLTDESFLNFCQQRNEADIAYWEAYIQDHPLQAPMIRQAQQEWRHLIQGIRQADLQAQLDLLKQQVERETVPSLQVAHTKKRTWLTLIVKYAVAAAVMVGVLVWALKSATRREFPPVTLAAVNQYVNEAGQRQQILLPDGSRVTLNAASNMRLGEHFQEGKRDIYLEGEAYFDVTPDAARPFTVYMKDASIRVLGTSFNARSYTGEDYTETVLIKGSVEITLKKENKTIRLQPSQKLLYKAASPDSVVQMATSVQDKKYLAVTPLTIDPKDSSVAEVAWMDNKLVFFDEPLDQLARRLERWYGIKIRIENQDMKQLRFSGTFEKEDLPKVLQVLQLTMPFHYRKESDSVIVLYK